MPDLVQALGSGANSASLNPALPPPFSEGLGMVRAAQGLTSAQAPVVVSGRAWHSLRAEARAGNTVYHVHSPWDLGAPAEQAACLSPRAYLQLLGLSSHLLVTSISSA